MNEFRHSVESWGAPSVNLVYADTAGDICWQAAAYVPRRTGWRGLTPVSGDGRFEWDGFLTAADLPAICNPESGFVHSANEMNLPEDWDHDAHPVGFEWFQDGRADRIAARIGGGHVQDVAEFCALQCDTCSALAARLIDAVPDTAPKAARQLLTGWDARAEADSGPALLFEIWFSSHLRPALLDRLAETSELRALLVPGNPSTVVQLFEGAHERLAKRAGLGTPPRVTRFWPRPCKRPGAIRSHGSGSTPQRGAGAICTRDTSPMP